MIKKMSDEQNESQNLEVEGFHSAFNLPKKARILNNKFASFLRLLFFLRSLKLSRRVLSKRIQDDADFVGMLVILGQSKFYFVMPICFYNDDYRCPFKA